MKLTPAQGVEASATPTIWHLVNAESEGYEPSVWWASEKLAGLRVECVASRSYLNVILVEAACSADDTEALGVSKHLRAERREERLTFYILDHQARLSNLRIANHSHLEHHPVEEQTSAYGHRTRGTANE